MDLNLPYGDAVDADGNVEIADLLNHEAETVSPTGTLSVVPGFTNAQTPTEIVADPTENGDLYVADYDANDVYRVSPSGVRTIVAGDGTSGAATPGPATSSVLRYPYGVAIDANGSLYIADQGNNEIEKATPAGTLSIIAGDGTAGAPTCGNAGTSSELDRPENIASAPSGRLYTDDSLNNTIDLLAPAAPVNTSVPSVAGTAQAGNLLTASEGSWSNSPVLYAYQWQDCDSTGANCVDITGATSSSCAPTSPDVGHTVRVEVTAENGGGVTVADSATSLVVVAAPATTRTAVATPATLPPTTPTAPTTTTTPTTTTGPSFAVKLSSSLVVWCHAHGCAVPANRLQIISSRAVSVRMVLKARTRGRWRTVATYRVSARQGTTRRGLTGHWHGQLVPARTLQLVVQTRTRNRWQTRKPFQLTVRHQTES